MRLKDCEVENFTWIVETIWIDIFNNVNSLDNHLSVISPALRPYLEDDVVKSISVLKDVFDLMLRKCNEDRRDLFAELCFTRTSVKIQGKDIELESWGQFQI